jgi:hypothetical protein
MIDHSGQVHAEVWLGSGYVVLLVLSALGFEWLARRTQRIREASPVSGLLPHNHSSNSKGTEPDDGRETIRFQAAWPHAEVARFHRGLSLLVLLVAGLVIAVVGVRHPTSLELGILGGLMVIVLTAGRYLWPAFRATRAGFE